MGRALLHAFEYAPQDKPWRKNQPERGEEGAVNLVFCSILGNHTLTQRMPVMAFRCRMV
jgi:hypothetical protein